jgi:hypothetical protein
VAGYLASAQQWAKFIKKWDKIKAEFSAPVFHANRFFPKPAFNKDYPGWSEQKRNQYIDKIITAIRTHRLTPIAKAVDAEAFMQLSEGKRRWLTGGVRKGRNLRWAKQGAPTKPYFPCFMRCLVQAARLTESGHTTHVYMDWQDQYAAQALALFQDFSDTQTERRISSLTFGYRSEFAPLQAADLLAYLWNVQLNKVQDRFTDQIMYMLHEKRDRTINVWRKADFEWITVQWPRLQAKKLVPPELLDEVIKSFDVDSNER